MAKRRYKGAFNVQLQDGDQSVHMVYYGASMPTAQMHSVCKFIVVKNQGELQLLYLRLYVSPLILTSVM